MSPEAPPLDDQQQFAEMMDQAQEMSPEDIEKMFEDFQQTNFGELSPDDEHAIRYAKDAAMQGDYSLAQAIMERDFTQWDDSKRELAASLNEQIGEGMSVDEAADVVEKMGKDLTYLAKIAGAHPSDTETANEVVDTATKAKFNKDYGPAISLIEDILQSKAEARTERDLSQEENEEIARLRKVRDSLFKARKELNPDEDLARAPSREFSQSDVLTESNSQAEKLPDEDPDKEQQEADQNPDDGQETDQQESENEQEPEYENPEDALDDDFELRGNVIDMEQQRKAVAGLAAKFSKLPYLNSNEKSAMATIANNIDVMPNGAVTETFSAYLNSGKNLVQLLNRNGFGGIRPNPNGSNAEKAADYSYRMLRRTFNLPGKR